MLKKYLILTFFYIGCINTNYSQELKDYQEINAVWTKFSQAFDSLDYQLMAKIHSKNLIRIPNGDFILDYKSYMKFYETDFEQAKKKNSTRSISLRFNERTKNNSIASERGVYKFIIDKDRPDEKIFYAKFHVLMVMEEGNWKISMDYDTNEGEKIDEDDFLKAYEMAYFKN